MSRAGSTTSGISFACLWSTGDELGLDEDFFVGIISPLLNWDKRLQNIVSNQFRLFYGYILNPGEKFQGKRETISEY